MAVSAYLSFFSICVNLQNLRIYLVKGVPEML
jgi:hypothetical protein